MALYPVYGTAGRSEIPALRNLVQTSPLRKNFKYFSPMAKKRVHLFVAGRVQGVNFRGSTRSAAQGAGVCGWVRNLEDGRVEAVIEGEEAAVEKVLEFIRRGPIGSAVTGVEVEIEEFSGELLSFEIKR